MSSASDDRDTLAALARDALKNGDEERAVVVLGAAAKRAGNDARLWQWTALLHRALDQHQAALDAFAAAARNMPGDALIAHGHARAALEAGVDARALFDAALRIEPSGDVLLGRAAARFASGEGQAAVDELAMVLAANPDWVQGHVQWAQLAAMVGRAEQATATIDRALDAHRQNPQLWLAAIDIETKAGRHATAARRADAATAAVGDGSAFALPRAAALSDAGESGLAAASFEQLGEPRDIGHAIHLARHLIRSGQSDRLAALADRWMTGDTAYQFWPYASIAWRQSGDPRWHWLEGDERLVSVIDLTPQLPQLPRLASRLHQLHDRSGRYLDQSVRGGTQTDGPLLSRIDPDICTLRAAIVEAVETYVASLPPIDPDHPLLKFRRDRRARFAGSWSVRLSAAGHHSNHVHPQGWISSAFYLALPDHLDGNAGWLTLGEPQAELATALPPLRMIEPKVGQLVLFPSMMWHGTVPFAAGQRMTVAFDVAPPV